MSGPWEAALPHERWQQSQDSAPVPQTVGLGHRGVSSNRPSSAQPLEAPPPDRSAGSVLSELLTDSRSPPPPTSAEGRPARAGRRAGRPATAPHLQGTEAEVSSPAHQTARPAQHGRRAGRANSSSDAPAAEFDASDIAQQVLGDTDGEAGSPPSYNDLDAKLRALSARDPKLAGMLDGQPRGSAKMMEQALELERLSGQIATLQRKLANTEQLLREAEVGLKQAVAEQHGANAKAAALNRQMEQRETSFRAELAKAQRDFTEQLAASRAEAERVVQAAGRRVEAIKLEAAEKESRMEEEMVEQVEQVRRRADERVAQVQADAESARNATPLIRSPTASTVDAERVVALDAALKKVKDDLAKERKRTRDMAKEHGLRKQELLEAQSALSKYETEQQHLQGDSHAVHAEAATAKATMLQRELDGMKTEATQQSRLRDDLVSQISGLRDELERAKAQVRIGAQAVPQGVHGEHLAKMRDEMAAAQAAMASLQTERQMLLRDKEEAAAQIEAMRRKLNAAPNAQSLAELTREYDQLKAAGNLAEAFPIGQRIRQLQRQAHRDSIDDDAIDDSMDGVKDSNKRSLAQADEEVAAVSHKLKQSEARWQSLCKVHRVMESQLVTAQLGYRMLKVELENTRMMLAEMEAEVWDADTPVLTHGTADPGVVADLLSGKTSGAILSRQPTHEPEPETEPEPEPSASGWGMGSLLSTVKTTLAWGIQTKSSQAATGPKQSEICAASDPQRMHASAVTAEPTSNKHMVVENDKLVAVRAMMISKEGDNGPSAEDVDDYARNVLGMDVEKHPHLIWIAEEALLQVDLPKGWVERIDATGRTFYKNKSTKETTYANPIDTAHRELYRLQVWKEEGNASKRARQLSQGTVEDRALQKLAGTHEGQCAILLNFYQVVDGGRTEDDVDRILRKRWHAGAQALTPPQWDSLTEKMKEKYLQCPMELWRDSNSSDPFESASVSSATSLRRSAKSEMEHRAERLNLQRLHARLDYA